MEQEYIVTVHQVTLSPPSVSTTTYGVWPTVAAARQWGEAQKFGATFIVLPVQMASKLGGTPDALMHGDDVFLLHGHFGESYGEDDPGVIAVPEDKE